MALDLFAGLFVLQAAALLGAAWAGKPRRFHLKKDASSVLGLGFCACALLLYPLIGLAAGQSYPAMPSFGVTPCPVGIFTFGMLLLGADRVPLPLLVVPGLWSLIGGSAAFLLHVPQDWMLLASGLVAVPLTVRRNRIAPMGLRET